MKCPVCGNELRPEAKFCNKCGSPVTQENGNVKKKAPGRTPDKAPDKKPKKGWKDIYTIAILIGVMCLAALAGLAIKKVINGQGEKQDTVYSSVVTGDSEEESGLADGFDFWKKDKEEASESPVVDDTPEEAMDEPVESLPVIMEEPLENSEQQETEEAGEEEEQTDYIIPNSDSVYLTENDLKQYTADELRLARNEIYARHGRRFNDEALQNYFDSKDWYSGTIAPENFSETVLNDYEKKNATLILDYEKAKGYV